MGALSIRMKRLRESKNLKQYELASALGIRANSLCRYETGAQNPTYETLKKLADFFDVSVDYLLGITNDPLGYNGDTSMEKPDFDDLYTKVMSKFFQLDDTDKRAVAVIVDGLHYKQIAQSANAS